MRIILSFLFLISSAHALDCSMFSVEVTGMEHSQKVESANTCKERYIEQLKQEITLLDKSTSNCGTKIQELQGLVVEVQEFYSTAITELRCEHPDPRVEAQMQRSMMDLIYALSERIEERNCSHLEYIETKANAQVEVLLLQDTKVQSF